MIQDNKPTIVLVGVSDIRGSTNVAQAKAFMKLGCNLIPVNYRTILQEHGDQYLHRYLTTIIHNYKPFLVLFSKCNGMNPQTMEMCSNMATTVYWFMDALPVAKNINALQYVSSCHLASATAPDVVEYFKTVNPNSFHIIEGLDSDVLHPVEPVEELKCDISFIGSRTEERDSYFIALKEAGFNVKFFGPQYSGSNVVDEDFAKVCASSKFALSLNTYNGLKNYFSDRIIRLLGCGVCTFHLDTTGTINNYFEDGKEIVYFTNPSDLVSKLRSIDNATVAKIALVGRDKILKNYLWEHQLMKLLKIVESGHASLQ